MRQQAGFKVFYNLQKGEGEQGSEGHWAKFKGGLKKALQSSEVEPAANTEQKASKLYGREQQPRE
jgi:hypothetical protein